MFDSVGTRGRIEALVGLHGSNAVEEVVICDYSNNSDGGGSGTSEPYLVLPLLKDFGGQITKLEQREISVSGSNPAQLPAAAVSSGMEHGTMRE